MSMVSYAAGSRYLSLLGGVCMSFYDWYCDLPPAKPKDLGRADGRAGKCRLVQCWLSDPWGSNVPQTRTPDAHFYTEVRYKGTKSVVVSPDYAEATKFADLWLHPKQGTDAALAMAMGHVILQANSIWNGRFPISTTTCAATPICRCWCAWCSQGEHYVAGPPAARGGFHRRSWRNQQPRMEDRRLRGRRSGRAARLHRLPLGRTG